MKRLHIWMLVFSAAFTAAKAEDKREFISARRVIIENDVRLCALHKVPLDIGSGFMARPPERVSAQSLREVVSFVYSYECPNRKPWDVFVKRISSRDIPTDFEFCTACDAALEERFTRWEEKPPTSEEFKKLLQERERREPNQALQPTRMLVTFCAYAQPAPSTRVADL